ncbi:MAG TPA: IS200/IS605 family transposase [Terriglobia bacterium]|nr:IS200/IS605 family transposase [Terriglobia bacterium]
MAHTYSNLLTHVIFSTKGREPLITPGLKTDLAAYLGGIVRELGGKVVAANSMPDHVHMLLWLPPSVAVADALRVVKTNSSRWARRTPKEGRGFAWQTGYAAFSVSQSSAAAVAKYIREQEKHHRRVSFQEELIAFLKKNGVEYDERYIWE